MSNTTEIKEQNFLKIIQAINHTKIATKPEIARLSSLTSVTVHNFINELLACGACTKTGNAQSNGGRKAALYKISENFGFIIGVELCRLCIKTAVFNLSLERIYYSEVPCSLPNVSDTMALLIDCIKTAIEKMKIPNSKYFGIGILLPGNVDKKNGIVIRLPDIPSWTNIPVKSLIEEQIGLSVFADNDSNARALSAKWTNLISDTADAVFFSVTDGVGIGVLLGGKLHYGTNSYAGEIGHTTIQFNGPLCKCGNRGCIEAMTSDAAILERALSLPDIPPESSIDDIAALAIKNRKSPVYEIFKETSAYISIALDHIVKVYDPEIIIVDNRWLRIMPELFSFVKEHLFTLSPWFRRDLFTIILAPNENFTHTSLACPVFESIMTYSPNNIMIRKIKQPCKKKSVLQ